MPRSPQFFSFERHLREVEGCTAVHWWFPWVPCLPGSYYCWLSLFTKKQPAAVCIMMTSLYLEIFRVTVIGATDPGVECIASWRCWWLSFPPGIQTTIHTISKKILTQYCFFRSHQSSKMTVTPTIFRSMVDQGHSHNSSIGQKSDLFKNFPPFSSPPPSTVIATTPLLPPTPLPQL